MIEEADGDGDGNIDIMEFFTTMRSKVPYFCMFYPAGVRFIVFTGRC